MKEESNRTLTRRVQTAAASPTGRKVIERGPTLLLAVGLGAEVGGMVSGQISAFDEGAAAVWLGIGAGAVKSARLDPSERNPIKIRSRALRRVLIGAGTVATAGVYAAEAAGVAPGGATALIEGAGLVSVLAGIGSGL